MRPALLRIIPRNYQANGVLFDGTNDFLARGSALTGAADGKVGLLSFWFRMTGGDSAGLVLFNFEVSGTARFFGQRTNGNVLHIVGRTTGAVDTLVVDSSTTYAQAMTKYAHVLVAWDLANAIALMYVDGVNVSASVTANNNNIAYATAITDVGVGATASTGAGKFNAQVSDFYLNIAETLDITSSGIRERFAKGGHPVNLGPTGAKPTGTAPILFLRGRSEAWTTNFGTGGNMALIGALTDAAANP